MDNVKLVAFNPSLFQVIDEIDAGSTEVPDDLQSRYGPGLVVMSLDEAWRLIHDRSRKPVREITGSEYYRFFGGFQKLHDDVTIDEAGATFKLAERLSGPIVAIFCEIQARYFHLADEDSLTHSEIIRRCLDYVSSHPHPPKHQTQAGCCNDCQHEWRRDFIAIGDYGPWRQYPVEQDEHCPQCGSRNITLDWAEFMRDN